MHRWGSLAALLWVALATTAVAQDVDPERERRARVLYEAGTAHFEVGDYESALREFRAAHAESPYPELLYNIFLCEERLGNLRAAVEALEGFLGTANVPRREILERRLAHLRERAARGETRIEASDVQQAHPLQVQDAPPADPSPAAVTPPAAVASAGPPVLAITGFAIGGAGLITFAVAGGITVAEDASLRGDGGCSPTCSPEQVQTLANAGIAADVGLGVAIAGTVLGVIGLLIDGGSPAPREQASVRLRGLSVEGTF
jgi:hypothetical protein